jgi:multiple sugar transport system permease protein
MPGSSASKDRASRRAPIAHAVRVDKVGARVEILRFIRATVATIIALIMLIPVAWMGMTAFKSRPDAVAVPPKVFFTPTLEGFVSLLTERAVLTQARLKALQEHTDLNWYERIALERGQEIMGASKYVGRLRNSLIIAGGSTVAAVVLGLLAGYAFSRFDVAGKADLLFFILSTRMLPAVVVTIPIFLMYRRLGLHDTHIGLILLYTVFNLSLSVWLLKGFIDEIPREYEEAALIDGYTRLQAFAKVVLPQALTGIAATTVFCLIFAWNEYAFALMLTTDVARTAPPAIPSVLGRGGVEWAAIAAGSMGFLVPVVIVTFALRRYLLRGVTFGAIRQ